VDYRAFLSPPAPVVLPYVGGMRVDGETRHYRIEGDLAPGWWRFRIDGRAAIAIERAEQPDLAKLPRVRGHWLDGWIVTGDPAQRARRIALPPTDEPARFARITAARWYDGSLLLASIDFDDDAEAAARDALIDQLSASPFGDAARSGAAGPRDAPAFAVAGASAGLRVAFGCALGIACARAAGVAITVPELVADAPRLAAEGAAAFAPLMAARAERIRVAQLRAAERAIQRVAAAARAAPRGGRDPIRVADEILAAAGGRLLAARRRGSELVLDLDVDGARVETTVDPETLQVIDAGFCVDGEDDQLSLDAMPSVIREALAVGHLSIYRGRR
jgi:hypothetical protein